MELIMKFMLGCILYSCITTLNARRRVPKGNRGIEHGLEVKKSDKFGSKSVFDADAKIINYANYSEAIKAVRLHDSGTGQLTRLEFFHEFENVLDCNEIETDERQELCLGPGEYITDVKGQSTFLYITWLRITTNLGRHVTAGTMKEFMRGFHAHNNGSPLLYASMVEGSYLYQVQFTFLAFQLSSPQAVEYYSILVEKLYNTWVKNVTDLEQQYSEIKWQLPALVEAECHRTDIEYSSAKTMCCQMQRIFQQLASAVQKTNKYKTFQPRILEYGNYDIQKLTELQNSAKEFRKLMTGISQKIKQNSEIQSAETQSIGNYFTKVVDYDREVSERDRQEMTERLHKLRDKNKKSLSVVSRKLEKILQTAFASLGIEAISNYGLLYIQFATAANPFSADFSAVLDRINTLAVSLLHLDSAGQLQLALHRYLEQIRHQNKKLKSHKNNDSFIAMKRAVTKFHQVGPEKQDKMAAKFIQAYDDYRPAIYKEDLVKNAEMLQGIANAGCRLIEKLETAPSVAVAKIVMLDCVEITADIKYFEEINEEIFNSQFMLIDTFTAIMRGNVAVQMTSKIQNLKDGGSIDLTTALIGSLMVELQFQSVAQASCDEIEYGHGGHRPKECENLFFTEENVHKIIAFDGEGFHTSTSIVDAYIPTLQFRNNNIIDPSYVWLNFTKFLTESDVDFTFTIPNHQWAIENGWLEQREVDEHPTAAYYVQAFEVYLPDVKCANGNMDSKIEIEATSSNFTTLFLKPESMKYIRRQPNKYKFVYSLLPKERCIKNPERFPVKKYGRTHSTVEEVCVTSNGEDSSSKTMNLASLLSTWTIKLSKDKSCDLVYQGQDQPKVTVKLKIVQIYDQKLNMCWPNTRCKAHETCSSHGLDHKCDKQ